MSDRNPTEKSPALDDRKSRGWPLMLTFAAGVYAVWLMWLAYVAWININAGNQ